MKLFFRHVVARSIYQLFCGKFTEVVTCNLYFILRKKISVFLNKQRYTFIFNYQLGLEKSLTLKSNVLFFNRRKHETVAQIYRFLNESDS